MCEKKNYRRAARQTNCFPSPVVEISVRQLQPCVRRTAVRARRTRAWSHRRRRKSRPSWMTRASRQRGPGRRGVNSRKTRTCVLAPPLSSRPRLRLRGDCLGGIRRRLLRRRWVRVRPRIHPRGASESRRDTRLRARERPDPLFRPSRRHSTKLGHILVFRRRAPRASRAPPTSPSRVVCRASTLTFTVPIRARRYGSDVYRTLRDDQHEGSLAAAGVFVLFSPLPSRRQLLDQPRRGGLVEVPRRPA